MTHENQLWFELFRKNYIDNYIRLIIKAYQSIPIESHRIIKKEEDRRTELVEHMRCLKHEFHINSPIVYEAGEKTKRMDICCYLNYLKEDYYICFECKRFLKNEITNSYIERKYYGEGIKRFEDGEYSRNMPQAGMVAFLESGNIDKLKETLKRKIPSKTIDKKIEDISLEYSFFYIFRTVHKRVMGQSLSLHHILLDLTN